MSQQHIHLDLGLYLLQLYSIAVAWSELCEKNRVSHLTLTLLLLTTWFFPNPNWLVSASNWLLNDWFLDDVTTRGTRDDTTSSSSASAVMILVTSRWAVMILGLESRWTRVASSGWDFNSSVAVGLALMSCDNSLLRNADIAEEQLHRTTDMHCKRGFMIIHHTTVCTYASYSFSWVSYSHIDLLNSQNPRAMKDIPKAIIPIAYPKNHRGHLYLYRMVLSPWWRVLRSFPGSTHRSMMRYSWWYDCMSRKVLGSGRPTLSS